MGIYETYYLRLFPLDLDLEQAQTHLNMQPETQNGLIWLLGSKFELWSKKADKRCSFNRKKWIILFLESSDQGELFDG